MFKLQIGMNNQEVLNAGEEYQVFGSEIAVLWDGDLESFLNDNDIELSRGNEHVLVNDKRVYLSYETLVFHDYEYGEDCEIVGVEEGTRLHELCLIQNNEVYTVDVICGCEACDLLNEELDFTTLKHIGTMTVQGFQKK